MKFKHLFFAAALFSIAPLFCACNDDDNEIISEQFISKDKNDYDSFKYWKAGIYNKPFLIQKTGQYKGYPLRNQNNVPGFSDHFPVYIYLVKEVK